MSNVILLAGSHNPKSRSTALLYRAGELLEKQDINIRYFGLSSFPAEDLIYARWNSPAIKEFIAAVGASDGLIVSTPVYKASYSGSLKLVLDLLPERALQEKAALALATGGSPGHLLAVEYALQPILSALKARHILNGLYATDSDFRADEFGDYQIAAPIASRLEGVIYRFAAHIPNPIANPVDPNALSRQIQAARISI